MDVYVHGLSIFRLDEAIMPSGASKLLYSKLFNHRSLKSVSIGWYGDRDKAKIMAQDLTSSIKAQKDHSKKSKLEKFTISGVGFQGRESDYLISRLDEEFKKYAYGDPETRLCFLMPFAS
jgi:hypothetical protein